MAAGGRKDAAAASSLVVVDLSGHPPGGALGMLLAPALSSSQHQHQHGTTSSSMDDAERTIVAGWERLPGGRLGPVQRAGSVRIGDRIVAVNAVDVTGMTFRRIMTLLRTANEGRRLAARGGGGRGGGGGGGGGGVGIRSLTFEPCSLEDGGGGSNYHRRTSATEDSSGSGGDHNGQHHQAASAVGGAGGGATRHQTRRYTFRSSVRRARIREERPEASSTATASASLLSSPSRDGTAASRGGHGAAAAATASTGASTSATHRFVEYEVVCLLVVRGMMGSSLSNGEEEERRWSVWRRFSDFQTLDKTLRDMYGWQIDAMDGGGAPFPSSRPLSSFFSKLSPAFVEQRRNELEEYWQRMMQLEEMTDFARPHRYSRELATFLSIDRYLDVLLPYYSRNASPSPFGTPEEARGDGGGGGRGGLPRLGLSPVDGEGWDGPGRGPGTGVRSDRVVVARRIAVGKSAFQRRVPGTFVGIMAPPRSTCGNSGGGDLLDQSAVR